MLRAPFSRNRWSLFRSLVVFSGTSSGICALGRDTFALISSCPSMRPCCLLSLDLGFGVLRHSVYIFFAVALTSSAIVYSVLYISLVSLLGYSHEHGLS